jgi:predicted nucleic acid-binding protein
MAMATMPASNPQSLVIDANVLVALCAKEVDKYAMADADLTRFAQAGYQFYAPGVIIAECLFVLGKKLEDGSLSARDHALAVVDLVLRSRVPFDGHRLASASHDGTLIKLWDLSTGREVLSLLRERGDPVADAGCRFDGNRLVLLNVSGNFKVWDATPLPDSSIVANPRDVKGN